MNDWNILSITSGTELVCHELLTGLGFTCWTPFEKRRQLNKTKNIKTHVTYADPIIPGWLFIQFDGSDTMKTALFGIMERRAMFYGALVTEGELYGMRDELVQQYKETLTQLANTSHKRIVSRGYDPALDSRKNKQRGFTEAITVPVFKNGQEVEFSNGAWAGLKLEVTEYGEEIVKLKADMMGQITRLQANPMDLQATG